MRLLGVDLGGTKIAVAAFNEEGSVLRKETVLLNGRRGKEVGELVARQILAELEAGHEEEDPVCSIAICVPGISNKKEGTVWAPNIPDWDKYPLLQELKQVAGEVPVIIESDRSCYILGEVWKGAAMHREHAVYLAVGTGIGAGIYSNGQVLRGAHDISGAIGWLALEGGFDEKFKSCGHFEYYASGEGIARLAKELMAAEGHYTGGLKRKGDGLTAHDVFAAYADDDELARAVFKRCITYWGMAVANLVSMLNPETVILGGGVFGPAKQFIPEIYEEAKKWGQPISMGLFTLEASVLEADAGLYGAGYAALKNLKNAKIEHDV